MENIFEKPFRVRSYEVDFRARVRPTALLNYLQDAAGEHAYRLGVAVTDLLPLNLTWVLSRSHLRIMRDARVGDVLRVLTWPSSREGIFSCREFEIYDREANIVALATSSWAVLDIASRRPVRLAGTIPDYPLLPRRAVDDDFSTLPRPERIDVELPFRVRMADLDLNQHVNNVVYAEWALETVPLEIVERCRLTEIEIGFRAEALYGDRVIARTAQTGGDSTFSFVHQLVNERDGKELTRLRTFWEKGEG